MKAAKRRTLMMTAVLFMAAIWGFIWVKNQTDLLGSLELVIFILIIISGIIALVSAFRKDRDERAGIPTEDEMSEQIKYKAGYYTYLLSMYMWLLIFIFNESFRSVETMLGGGILLSGFMSFVVKYFVTRRLHD